MKIFTQQSGENRPHQLYDLFKTEKINDEEQVLKDKLNGRMKSNYLNNVVEQMDQGKIKCTDKQICTEKLKEFCKKSSKKDKKDFIKVLNIFLQGAKEQKSHYYKLLKKFKIKSIEIKNLYFENVKDFIYQTDLTGKVVKIGGVQVPCILYPRPLKPPSWWNNTWIRCSLVESKQSRERQHIIKNTYINVYRDTFDAWFLKEEYIENFINFHGLKYRITSLNDIQNFKKSLEERREIDLNIEEMFLDFKDISESKEDEVETSESKEDEVETTVVKKKEHKLITKQKKLVKQIEDELKSINSFINKYDNIKDVITEIQFLKGKPMTVNEYNREQERL